MPNVLNRLRPRLDKALDAAPAEHWIVIDMKRDWRIIFPFEKK
ncbi:MAG TPA: hypothetical protein VNS10_05360 [Gemmatimonadaceae bacterium]|jgi:hypothetical protein|nr:hypothetical protein [Gemmatimonadaceae bacterium]